MKCNLVVKRNGAGFTKFEGMLVSFVMTKFNKV